MATAGTSKVILGATLAMFVTLAVVLSLVLVLLAELYCSLFFRRRQAKSSTTTATVNDDSENTHQPNSTPSLCNFYSQGVLRAPRSFLFPASATMDLEKQQPHLHIPNHNSSAPSSSYPWPIQESSPPSANTSGRTSTEQLIYICNPIYDNEANIRIISKIDTPFETPGSSPSRLETGEGSSTPPSSPTTTPPLTPMKKLPEQGTSVSLRDARSICPTGSDSNSNNDGISSSSSGSPCTSPSW
ncbi:hypothetical protein CDL12_16641 [Handroanthus impetiginosus]|uniref:Uncharacterized protein n=1 Tax=Handroanthus impetiginosus TaxID=429701 RepID=A0A2G9GZQ4_9LAMI|nr:hypothetical protein CDL12_16641 [Handroanthus impetiginosus]